jgi:hypothetical protein
LQKKQWQTIFLYFITPPVVLNLFLGGDTHFEIEKLATNLDYPDYANKCEIIIPMY